MVICANITKKEEDEAAQKYKYQISKCSKNAPKIQTSRGQNGFKIKRGSKTTQRKVKKEKNP